jgi:hypothetical protein
MLKGRYDSKIQWSSRIYAMEILVALALEGDERCAGFVADRVESGLLNGDTTPAKGWLRLHSIADVSDVLEIIARHGTCSYRWHQCLMSVISTAAILRGQEGRDTVEAAIAENGLLTMILKVKRPPALREMPPFDEFLDYVRSSDVPRHHWYYVGSHADEQTLFRCANAAITETDPRVIAGFLRMFRSMRKIFPLDVAHLLRLARHDDEWVRYWSIALLEFIDDPRIRELAEECSWLGRDFEASIRLFASNHKKGDFDRLWKRAQELGDDLDTHDFIRGFGEIADKSRSKKRVEYDCWVYENSPCAACRGFAVLRLRKSKAVPDEWLEELRFDVDVWAREVAAEFTSA